MARRVSTTASHCSRSRTCTPTGRQNACRSDAFVEEARSGPRRYQNALALVLPDAGQFDQARQAARSWLAAQSLLRQKAKYGFSPEQADELKEKAETSQRAAAAAVGRGYASVVTPLKDRGGEAAYNLE